MHLDVRLDTIIVINREAKPFPYPDFTLANLENNICEFSLCKTVLKWIVNRKKKKKRRSKEFLNS